MKKLITVIVNNRKYEEAVHPNMTLTRFLREELGLVGTKEGCGVGDCGACTVIMDGKPVNSCLVLAVEAHGSEIVTIEGIARTDTLHPVQETFIELGAIQCGFCTPGMILSAISLLKDNPDPKESDIRQALSGNLCRCTGYQKIVEAVQRASKKLGCDGHKAGQI